MRFLVTLLFGYMIAAAFSGSIYLNPAMNNWEDKATYAYILLSAVGFYVSVWALWTVTVLVAAISMSKTHKRWK